MRSRYSEEPSPTSNCLIQVKGLYKSFCKDLKRSLFYGVTDAVREMLGMPKRHGLRSDEFWAINGVDFELKAGECLGLIGRNGAGKTTLLKMLTGLIRPDGGSIRVRGKVGALIALGAGFNPVLSGRENVFINAAVLGLSREETRQRLAEIIDFAEIGEFIDAPVQSYSSGMVVRLGFAITTVLKPDILLLDEVLAVGDAEFQAKCFNTLSARRKEGSAFILVTHNMHQMKRYADRVVYLKNGQIEASGDPTRCIAKYEADALGESPSTREPVAAMGTGRVKFSSVSFCDQSGRVIDQVGPHEPVTLSISFDCRSTNNIEPVLDVMIRDHFGVLYQSTSDDSETPFEGIPDNGVFLIAFSSIPSASTELFFYFTLLDRRTKEIFDWRRELVLKCRPDCRQTGRLCLRTRWSIASSAADSVVERVVERGRKS